MTIIKRGKTFGVRVYDSEQHKPRWLGTFSTKKEAREAAAEWYATPRARSGKLTVAQLSHSWLNDWADDQNWRTSTRLHNTERVSRFVERYGRERADSFSVKDGLAWARDHRGEVPALRAMFGYGRLIDAVHSNPFAQLGGSRRAKRSKGEIRKLGRGALTEQEVIDVAAIATRLHGSWHGSLITFAAYTCMREGEIYALRFSDLGHDELTVAHSFSSKTGETNLPKNDEQRVIIYPPQARQAVRAVPRQPNQQFVFVSPRDKNRLTSAAHGYYWRQARSAFEAALPATHWLAQRIEADPKHGHLKFHELRHTGATLLLERGVSHADVAVQMGHTDGGALVMSTYGHPSQDLARQRLKAAYSAAIVPLRAVADAHTAEEDSA
jgi:integrase